MPFVRETRVFFFVEIKEERLVITNFGFDDLKCVEGNRVVCVRALSIVLNLKKVKKTIRFSKPNITSYPSYNMQSIKTFISKQDLFNNIKNINFSINSSIENHLIFHADYTIIINII